MSRHHTLPPIVYTPPPLPKKIETKKRRIGIGALDDIDEAADAREATGTGQATPVTTKLPPQNFPEIEGSDRKPQNPSGRLSQSTLTVLLRAQEVK
jgi:hypothetical protein